MAVVSISHCFAFHLPNYLATSTGVKYNCMVNGRQLERLHSGGVNSVLFLVRVFNQEPRGDLSHNLLKNMVYQDIDAGCRIEVRH